MSFGAVWTAHAWGAVRGPAVVTVVAVLSTPFVFPNRGLIPMAFATGAVPRDSTDLGPLLGLGFPLWRGRRGDGTITDDDRVFTDVGPLVIWPAAYVPYGVWYPGMIWGGLAGDAGRRIDASMSVRVYDGAAAVGVAGAGVALPESTVVAERGPAPWEVMPVTAAVSPAEAARRATLAQAARRERAIAAGTRF